MWIVRVTFLFLGVIALLWLLQNNAAFRSDFTFFGREFYLIPVNYIMLVSFLAGMLFWFLISLVNEIVLRQQIRKLKKRTDALNRELIELRNLPLEESAREKQPASESAISAVNASQ